MLDIKISEKFFDEKLILEKIDFSIKQGEFISIVGPSGCGKTTLLNIIASLDKDFKGELKAEVINISFMFQDDRLLPWLSVKDNLLLVSKTKDLDEIKQLLKTIGLEDILEMYPNSLSGGMKRRVALLRAFINSPELILLDEPFISLDFPTAWELKKEFLNLCKKFNPMVLLVTHDISEAILFSNNILFLSKNPSKIILNYENRNNQKFDNKQIDEIKNEIFDTYPNILKGEI